MGIDIRGGAAEASARHSAAGRGDPANRLLDTAAPGSDLKSSALVLDFRHQAYASWHFTHGRIVDARAGYNALITPRHQDRLRNDHRDAASG